MKTVRSNVSCLLIAAILAVVIAGFATAAGESPFYDIRGLRCDRQ